MKERSRIEIIAFRRRTTMVIGNKERADDLPPDAETPPDCAAGASGKEVDLAQVTDLPELAQWIKALMPHHAAPASGFDARRRKWRAAIKRLRVRLRIFRR